MLAVRGELIITGDEVLDGRVLNTNAQWLASRLAAVGLGVSRVTTVGDDPQVLVRVLGHAARKADFVLVTGGLGPTDDDLTTAAAAQAFDRPLTLCPEVLSLITAHCRERGREVGALERLAYLPQGAKPLSPERAVCGFALDQPRSLVIFLPGVPEEVRWLVEHRVLALLLARFSDQPCFAQRVLKVLGPTESEVAGRLAGLAQAFPTVLWGSYPIFPEVHLSLTVRGADRDELARLLDRVEAEARSRLGRRLFGRDEETLASVLGGLLKARGLTLATAESCTGGRAAQMITAVPGASAYFIEGVVTYANRAKVDLLGLDPALLAASGAVSPQVAAAMAEGLRARARVDLALASTGVAGPDGGSPAKPVGTVYLALAAAERTVVEGRLFRGDRERVQIQAAAALLDLGRIHLLEEGPRP
jgi:nicotinamide-nucleotide amidase